MVDFEQVRWAISHDPCRAGDRTPTGAVPEGTIVHLTLRVAREVRHFISSVSVLVGERLPSHTMPSWSEMELSPSDEGYAGFVALESVPHVTFYAFSLHFVDGSLAYYVPRADGRATAGQLVIPGPDGEWSVLGWEYAPSRVEGRAAGDFGLPDVAPGFQITTFNPDFRSPEWLSGAVMYQIFSDRFATEGGLLEEGLAYHERMDRPVHAHKSWSEPVEWEDDPPLYDAPRDSSAHDAADDATAPDGAEAPLPYDPVDFYGGTLSGICGKLDYLASLGVEVIYLNPILEARSNHRYDTANYEQIDPLLGTLADFEHLAEEAAKRGISIVLDAVLSHTGNVSRYFNADGVYDEPGAAQGPESPFYSWFDFGHGGAKVPYRCWWGDPTLPEVDERNQSWQRYMFGTAPARPQDGPDAGAAPASPQELGILPYWLAKGARGYRLDVADEIPDDVLERIRTCVKAAHPEAAIIGEVWEDATTKASYGEPRSYALGGALDSVMNYPLRSALIGFALGGVDALQLAAFLKMQQANYPAPLYTCLMNLLSSHDVERVRSALATGEALRHVPRAEQREIVAAITEEQDAEAAHLQGMIAALMYALPGAPCIYYGEERGMHGGGDPFCRATFPWDAAARADVGADLTERYQALGIMRKGSEALRHGAFTCSATDPDVFCAVRIAPDRQTATVVACNRADHVRTVAFDASAPESGLPSADRWAIRCASAGEVVRAVCPDAEGAALVCEDGILRMSVPPQQTVFWTLPCGQ